MMSDQSHQKGRKLTQIHQRWVLGTHFTTCLLEIANTGLTSGFLGGIGGGGNVQGRGCGRGSTLLDGGLFDRRGLDWLSTAIPTS